MTKKDMKSTKMKKSRDTSMSSLNLKQESIRVSSAQTVISQSLQPLSSMIWKKNLMKRIKVENMSKKESMEFQKRIVDKIRLDTKGEKQIIKLK